MEISNHDDIIDSRDVIERIVELESDAWDDFREELDLGRFTDDEREEYDALKALAAQGEDAPDWSYGATLIHDSYFEDYARQLAEDIGAISGNEEWPLSYIDWEAAAEALQMDYTSIEFDGETYWIR